MDNFVNQNTSSPWAYRRKAIILGFVILILAGFALTIFWKYWYTTPNCFDGRQNGDETGVDCGGSCALVCDGEVITPIVKWDPRLFEVSSGVWSALVYVENPNTDVDAVYVPYVFTIYGENNKVLVERKNATILPKNKTVGIFEGVIKISDGAKPKRATFEIEEGVIWKKNEKPKNEISVTHGSILKLDSEPKVLANIKNNGTEEIKNIELVIAIFDGSDNAIAASRTLIGSLKKNESTDVSFTWSKPFALGSKVCEYPSDTIIILDRSGSMSSLKSNITQPLADAKNAAESFVEKLSARDKVGVVSFATEAKDPIDLALTSDFETAKKSIDAISIETDGTQYTNIYDALRSAWQELLSARAQDNSSKVAVLLTDGVANNPRNPDGGTEEEDIKYAESLAEKEASDMKKDGIILYTIGLGDEINETFLKSIASKEENYFFAPTSENLEEIYKNISSDLCNEVPARVEITYKIFGSSI